MKPRPDWTRDGGDWPNRTASRFVTAGGLSWHVQIMGSGPALLLLHGTGAATHSWRDLAPLLSRDFTVIAPDLPGHGFTELRARAAQSLPGMADALRRLLATLEIVPDAVVGHSAGAAIALRMVLDRQFKPRAVISLNGALLPFPGVAAFLFPALAKLMFLNPFAAPILAHRADDPAAIARLIEGTGSRLDATGLQLYGRLLRTRRHVEATLAMMANWDLVALRRDLPRVSMPLTLVAADGDIAVPPSVARETAALVPGAAVIALHGLGHLAHEEAPEMIADIIRKACA
jgi:magnesium chelatase accessory protein